MKSLPVALLLALALAGCSHGSSSMTTTSQSASQTSPEASTAASMAPAAASPMAASPMASAQTSAAPSPATSGSGATIPTYPGSTNVMTATANGQTTSESTTKDSFDTVYAWYRSQLPSGSEAERLTIGNVREVVFKVGDSTASIAASNGETVINITNKP